MWVITLVPVLAWTEATNIAVGHAYGERKVQAMKDIQALSTLLMVIYMGAWVLIGAFWWGASLEHDPHGDMPRLHEAAERHARPSNPLASPSRAVISLHAGRWIYPDGDDDRARALENGKTPWHAIESSFPSLVAGKQPVLVDERVAREAVVNAWIGNDKRVDGGDPTVVAIACSVQNWSKKSVGKFVDLAGRVSGISRDPSMPMQHLKGSAIRRGSKRRRFCRGIYMDRSRLDRHARCRRRKATEAMQQDRRPGQARAVQGKGDGGSDQGRAVEGIRDGRGQPEA